MASRARADWASGASAVRTAGTGPVPRSARESASRQSPPKSMICSAVSLSEVRPTYCWGRLRPRTSAPAGAHCGPTRRPTRPANVSVASPPRTGPMASAPVIAVHPEAAGQQQRQARHDRRIDRGAADQEASAREVQSGVGAAEGVQRLRDGQRAMLGDPVAGLQVRARIAQHDERPRSLSGELPAGQPGHHRDRRQQAEPGGPAGLAFRPPDSSRGQLAGTTRRPLTMRAAASDTEIRVMGKGRKCPASSSGTPGISHASDQHAPAEP